MKRRQDAPVSGPQALIRSALALTALVAVSAPAGAAEADGRQIAGEVVSVSGKVFIRQDGRAASGPLAAAKGGDALRAGDIVNTSSDGQVKLLLKDKTVVDLGPSALFKVEKFDPKNGTDREFKGSMMYGNLRAAVSQKITGTGKFQVRTPTATMGVRGTEFVIKSDPPATLAEIRQVVLAPEKTIAPAPASENKSAKTEITVIQGRVDVEQKVSDKSGSGEAKKAAPVVLTAGTQLVTKQEDKVPAKAVKLEAQQVAQIAQSVKVQDNTFQKAVIVDTGGKDSGAGEATRALIGTAMANVTIPQITMGNAGFTGTFNAMDLTRGPGINYQAGLKNLTVVIQK